MAKQNRKKRGRYIPSQQSSEQGDGIPPLPDTTTWQPRESATGTLQDAFLKRCISIESLVRIRAQHEREMNIDNFDAGAGIEDIIRSEFSRIFPNRYSVKAGVINDRNGKTGGDFDVIIFNDQWFPTIKTGATLESRRFHFPIEGVYGVCEVKQTIDFHALDKAMEKLVICHRLYRPHTFANRLVENRDFDQCFHGLTNPLYSAIIATGLKEGVSLDKIVERFFYINKTLKRTEMVRSLCILGHGTITWGSFLDGNTNNSALFMRDDLFWSIFPVYHKFPETSSPLYSFAIDIMSHLYNSVLAAEDIVQAYGPSDFEVSIPTSPDITIEPDQEWLEKMGYSKDKHDNLFNKYPNLAEQLRDLDREIKAKRFNKS